MNRLKAWFHNVVVAEVQKVLLFLKAEIATHVTDTFLAERRKLAEDVLRAKAEMAAWSEKLHATSLAKLEASMEAQLKAFKARVEQTLEETLKDEPAHWKAELETIEQEILLRTPKR